MTWFENLTGFPERSPQQVRENLIFDGHVLKSRVNGKVMACGRLETPSLAELRERALSGGQVGGKLSVREIMANVQHLHVDPSNAGSLFQVASQFNLLEMTSPYVTPEHGVGVYEQDFTQGPACAIAAGSGTIYRNYFAIVNGQTGQSSTNQIDCLADVGKALGNFDNRLWEMKNGYALASRDGLSAIANRLLGLNEDEIDKLRKLLRIGIQWNTQVTFGGCTHTVSQVYCSALPVAYLRHDAHLWEQFARLILESSYEATVCAAILNSRSTGSPKVFLTLLGGGAFGNATAWIIEAMQRALDIYRDCSLDVAIVSFGSSTPEVRQLVDRYRSD